MTSLWRHWNDGQWVRGIIPKWPFFQLQKFSQNYVTKSGGFSHLPIKHVYIICQKTFLQRKPMKLGERVLFHNFISQRCWAFLAQFSTFKHVFGSIWIQLRCQKSFWAGSKYQPIGHLQSWLQTWRSSSPELSEILPRMPGTRFYDGWQGGIVSYRGILWYQWFSWMICVMICCDFDDVSFPSYYSTAPYYPPMLGSVPLHIRRIVWNI